MSILSTYFFLKLPPNLQEAEQLLTCWIEQNAYRLLYPTIFPMLASTLFCLNGRPGIVKDLKSLPTFEPMQALERLIIRQHAASAHQLIVLVAK